MREKQSTDANGEMSQMLELSDRDCKAATTKMSQQPVTNYLETSRKIENLSA